MQGLIEPTVTSMTIKFYGARHGRAHLAVMLRLLCTLCILGVVATTLQVATLDLRSRGMPRLETLLLISMSSVLFLVNTVLMGIGYARHQHRTIVRAYAVSGVLQTVLIIVLAPLGLVGFFLAMFAWQLTATAIYVGNRSIRRYAAVLLHAKQRNWMQTLKNDIAPAMSSRLTIVALTVLSVVWVAAISSPSETASYKITLTMTGLFKFLIPISPEMLQTYLGGRHEGQSSNARNRVRLSLIVVFLLACVGSLAMYAVAGHVRMFLLGPTSSPPLVDALFVGAPFLFLINPLSSVLYSLGKRRLLMIGAALSIGVMTVAGALNLVPLGVSVGAFVYVVAVASPYLSLRSLLQCFVTKDSRMATSVDLSHTSR